MAEQVDSKSRDHCKQSVILQRTEATDSPQPQVIRRRSLTIAHLYLTSASLARTRTQSLTRPVSLQASPDSQAAPHNHRPVSLQASLDSHSDPHNHRPVSLQASLDPHSDTPNHRPVSERTPRDYPSSANKHRRVSLQTPLDCHSTPDNHKPVSVWNPLKSLSDPLNHRPVSLHTSLDQHSDPHNPTPLDLTDLRSDPNSARQPPRPKSDFPRPQRRGVSRERPSGERPPTEGLNLNHPPVVHRPRVKFERPKSEHHSRKPFLEYRDVIVRDSDQKRVVPRRPRSERRNPASRTKTSN